MKFSIIVRLILSAILLASPISAFETDQYNLPPEPLADIGDEFTEYLEKNLRKAIGKVNSEIAERQLCLENNNRKLLGCDSAERERARLSYLQSEDAVAAEVYKLLGTGFPPFTRSGGWLESHRFAGQPARYKTGYLKSIFAIVPTDYITISSTVKMYGTEFGTDKIAHIFQQGYTYYKSYKHNLEKGSTPTAAAAKKAIRWGKLSERTFYGTLVSGVYSNGDLSANYIGLKFYQGLAREISIGDYNRPPILLFQNGIWKINEKINLREILFKPFVSNHLNEALNPSIFTKVFGIRAYVRRAVRKHSCKQWKTRFPNLSQKELNDTTESLKLWYGEDYGFTERKNFVTIANTCFDSQGKFIERKD